MSLKLIKEHKKNRLNTLYRYITEFRILKEKKDFTWTFIRYYIEVTLLNRYDIIRLPVDKVLVGLIFIKKYKSEGYLDIISIQKADKKNLKEIDVLQKLKIAIESYRALGYNYIEATFPYYVEDNLNFLLYKIGFGKHLEKNLTNMVNNKHKDFVTLIKILNNG